MTFLSITEFITIYFNCAYVYVSPIKQYMVRTVIAFISLSNSTKHLIHKQQKKAGSPIKMFEKLNNLKVLFQFTGGWANGSIKII